MRINKQIRALDVRLINSAGEQVGVVSTRDALTMAAEEGLDLVEISPNSKPPVCKIIDYGKFRYDQTKREKESKKASHQIKVKEVKLRPNINEHDFIVKLKRAREFAEKGNKIKVTCMLRGREAAHPELAHKVLKKMCNELEDLAAPEVPMKSFGRIMTVVLAPVVKKKKI